MHEGMARDLSSRGEHRIVGGADHLSLVTDREYAGEVADAISLVVRKSEAR